VDAAVTHRRNLHAEVCFANLAYPFHLAGFRSNRGGGHRFSQVSQHDDRDEQQQHRPGAKDQFRGRRDRGLFFLFSISTFRV
jgi:hypothetical protein